MKMSELPLYPTIQTTITDIMISERNQRQKTLYCPIAFTCKVQKQAERTYGVRNQDSGYLEGRRQWEVVGRGSGGDSSGPVMFHFLSWISLPQCVHFMIH